MFVYIKETEYDKFFKKAMLLYNVQVSESESPNRVLQKAFL